MANIPIYEPSNIPTLIYTIYQLLSLRAARQSPFQGKRFGNGLPRLKPRLVYCAGANRPNFIYHGILNIPYKHTCPDETEDETDAQGEEEAREKEEVVVVAVVVVVVVSLLRGLHPPGPWIPI